MKPFKTLDEQIDILLDRGLTIDNQEKTKNYLLQYSYYNVINVYSKFFQNQTDKYIPGSTFDEIRAVHVFDTEIKSIFFKYLIECEKHFKSIVAYRFSEFYKDIPLAYLQTNCYRDDNLLDLSKTISLLSKTITMSLNDRKNNNAIKHYRNNHDNIPLWVLVNHLTFGQTVHMYVNFTDKLKNIIAKDVASYLNDNVGERTVVEPKELENFLFNLIDLRNCVAHNNMLFHFKCKRNMNYIRQIHSPANIIKTMPRQDPFNCFLMMQLLLQKEQYALFHNTVRKRVRSLNHRLQSISADHILTSLGFPKSWTDDTKIKPQPN